MLIAVIVIKINNCVLNCFSLQLSEAPISSAASPLQTPHDEHRFPWDSREQGFVLSAFFYGYVLTQIPFGLMAKRWGALRFLGYGMLLNSVVGLLVPLAARLGGRNWLIIARFVQGLGEVSPKFNIRRDFINL